ncbi:hypothetical protein OHB12_00360 [Nocardia sp. NBC_01730]|uniref:hypothetical protein n=1 Tax=Nocardia sp. NBC_01730 TaxID=2975998 RepID=UPI002E12025F|nr:hypothetical protein OHB12_00360 [Nocardia sp. NBC_01730]
MSWIGTDLGLYRPCVGTYRSFPVGELPALPDHLFDGTFSWLVPGEVRASMGVDPLPEALRHQVPAAFAAFFDRPELQQAVPSCTGCYWDVSASVIPGPFGNGDRLVRILADSQDCVLWYLHILSDGTHQVVAAGERYGDDEPLPPVAQLNSALTLVADDFERFLYRFWVENTAWFEAVSEERDERNFSPAVRDYLAALPKVFSTADEAPTELCADPLAEFFAELAADEHGDEHNVEASES